MNHTQKLIASRQLRRAKVLLWACGIFVVLSVLAMVAFRGGNLINPFTTHYNIIRNYLSDLGVTETLNGAKNFGGSMFFIVGTAILGLGMLDFATNWKNFAANNDKTYLVGPASAILLGAAGIALVCVAITPWNVYFREHVLFTKLFFGLIFGWSVCYSYLLFVTKQAKGLFIASAINAVLLGFYVLWISFGPIYGGGVHIAWQAGLEKLVVYVTVANLAYQAYNIKQRLSRR